MPRSGKLTKMQVIGPVTQFTITLTGGGQCEDRIPFPAARHNFFPPFPAVPFEHFLVSHGTPLLNSLYLRSGKIEELQSSELSCFYSHVYT